MIVMKFGGTSVEDSGAIERAAEIARGRLAGGPWSWSAHWRASPIRCWRWRKLQLPGSLPEAADLLWQLRLRHLDLLPTLVSKRDEFALRELIHKWADALQEVLGGMATRGELSARTSDMVLSVGELLSSAIVSAAFHARGIDSVLVDSRRCIVTDASHTRAVPLLDQTAERLRHEISPRLQANQVPVMGGFIAATADGITTTLGRGGSDFSAAIIGAALNAGQIEIWTDVEGMMTTDPRRCPRAQRIDEIGFDEASELAYFGAKVLHPATLIPAVQKDIPVYVLNARQPKNPGTRICSSAPRGRTVFRAIAARKGIQVVNVKSPRMLMAHGFLRKLFEIFERHGCTADLVSTSEVSVSVALDAACDVGALLHDLKQLGEAEAERGKAIICLVGKHIRGRSGIAAKVFQTVAEAGINVHMISQGASEINISFVVEESDVHEAVRHLHRCFFEDGCLSWPAESVSRLHAPSLASRAQAQPQVR